jgi:hypothetical protein
MNFFFCFYHFFYKQDTMEGNNNSTRVEYHLGIPVTCFKLTEIVFDKYKFGNDNTKFSDPWRSVVIRDYDDDDIEFEMKEVKKMQVKVNDKLLQVVDDDIIGSKDLDDSIRHAFLALLKKAVLNFRDQELFIKCWNFRQTYRKNGGKNNYIEICMMLHKHYTVLLWPYIVNSSKLIDPNINNFICNWTKENYLNFTYLHLFNAFSGADKDFKIFAPLKPNSFLNPNRMNQTIVSRFNIDVNNIEVPRELTKDTWISPTCVSLFGMEMWWLAHIACPKLELFYRETFAHGRIPIPFVLESGFESFVESIVLDWSESILYFITRILSLFKTDKQKAGLVLNRMAEMDSEGLSKVMNESKFFCDKIIVWNYYESDLFCEKIKQLM